jgi:hypothetical protein
MLAGMDVGIVHVDDLADVRPWAERRIDRVLERLGAWLTTEVWSQLEPPGGLVVVVRSESVDALRSRIRWIARARAVAVVVDWHESQAGDGMRAGLEAELAAMADGVPLVGILHWSAANPAAFSEAILRVARADPVPRREPARAPKDVAARPGPWIQLPDPDVFRHRPGLLAAALCFREGRPALVDMRAGRAIDLHSGEVARIGAPMSTHFWAVDLDGRRALVRSAEPPVRTDLIDLAGGRPVATYEGLGVPIGFDPLGGHAWAGGRCIFDWLWAMDGELGMLTRCEHDWPCGHAKKQYGYLDNDPLWVHVAADRGAYLSMYEKDAVIASHVPLRWVRWTAVSVQRTEVRDDPLRALFYAREPDGRMDQEAIEEDARDTRPVMTLGPDDAMRYALDLRHLVVRVQGDTATEVGGPEAAYAAFDAQHRLVRKSPGRLLGGWGGWLTVLDHEHLFRSPIGTGARRFLCAVEMEPDYALPIPATPHVVLVREREDTVWLRFV